MTGKRILLVEDNPDDVDLTLRAFRQNEEISTSTIVVARDGVEALLYLHGDETHSPGEKPSLILLDINLPRMDGIEVLRRIRNHPSTRHLPVVMLTSSSEDRDLADSYGLGANSYVRKPVDFTEFVRAAGRLGIYWLELNRPPPGVP